jgi:serine/threonine protein kinase
MLPMIGQTLGHYRIESKLGEGGMGVVYRAYDTHLNRPVAIKVLSAEAVSNAERKRRFVQEARTASALNHPNILHIYDIDQSGDIVFIAMEFVPGETLSRLIGQKGIPLPEALKYAVQIGAALARAHTAGIVHRDIKPANVMVTDGLVKVLDFGLAKLMDRGDDVGESARTETVITPHTEEGAIIGTINYMSPEQAEGKKIDARSDIFSFGSVFYEIITGRRAFEADSKLATLSAILTSEPKALGELLPQVPPELDQIITRCLRKEPDRRFQHMSDLKVALEELEEKIRGASSSRREPAPTAPTSRRLASRRGIWSSHSAASGRRCRDLARGARNARRQIRYFRTVSRGGSRGFADQGVGPGPCRPGFL